MSHWLDQLKKVTKEETGGGGRVYTKANFMPGYYAYASFTGQDREKAVVIPDTASEEDRDKARAVAQTRDVNKKANWCLIIKMHKDTAYKSDGNAVTWSFDQYDAIPLWTLNKDEDSAARVVTDAMDKLGVATEIGKDRIKDYWVAFEWRADPFKKNQGEKGKTKMLQDGTYTWPTIPVPVEKFASYEAMMAELNKSTGGVDLPDEDWGISESKLYEVEGFPGEMWEGAGMDWKQDYDNIVASIKAGSTAESESQSKFGEDVLFLYKVGLHVTGNVKKVATDLNVGVNDIAEAMGVVPPVLIKKYNN